MFKTNVHVIIIFSGWHRWGRCHLPSFGGPHHIVWDLPQPGIEPVPPAFGAQYLNCGTTREVPSAHFKFPSLNLFILIGELLCNIVLASVIHQNEPAIGTRTSPRSQTPLPPPAPSYPSRLSQSTRFELPASYSKFPLPSAHFRDEKTKASQPHSDRVKSGTQSHPASQSTLSPPLLRL